MNIRTVLIGLILGLGVIIALAGFVLTTSEISTETSPSIETPSNASPDFPVDEEIDRQFDVWMENTNWSGKIVDKTTQDVVRITVGGRGNEMYSLSPPVLRISTGTTIQWDWQNSRHEHKIINERQTFESKLTNNSTYTFEHTFEESGTYYVSSEDYKSYGMKGVIIVE